MSNIDITTYKSLKIFKLSKEHIITKGLMMITVVKKFHGIGHLLICTNPAFCKLCLLCNIFVMYSMYSSCGSVGRARASDTRCLQLESSHMQFFAAICRKDKNEEKEVNGQYK